MPANHDENFLLDGILDDTPGGFIGELPDIDQVPEFFNVQTGAQQTNFSLSGNEELPNGAPQPHAPQLFREPLPVQPIGYVNNQVISDVSPQSPVHDMERNNLPEDFEILNEDCSRTYGGHKKNTSGVQAVQLNSVNPTQVDVTVPNRSYEHMNIGTPSNQHLASQPVPISSSTYSTVSVALYGLWDILLRVDYALDPMQKSQ